MTDTKHGGPRPKVRDDDPRGGAREGAGRPQTTKRVRKNETYTAVRVHADGREETIGVGTIVEMDRASLTLTTQDGDTIILRRG